MTAEQRRWLTGRRQPLRSITFGGMDSTAIDSGAVGADATQYTASQMGVFNAQMLIMA
jgi:hypothetical protein